MAGQSDLLNRLAALVRPFDDAAWEALANKGLLRRARKDLEGGALPVRVEGETPGGLRLAVGALTVVVPEAGPAKATCSCPAAGICQHILAAGLFLQKVETAVDPPSACGDAALSADPAAVWLGLDLDAVRQWTGAAEFRAAVTLAVADDPPPAVETSTAGLLIVRFPGAGAECRLMPGGTLDGIIVSGGSAKHAKRLATAAVLALRRSRGVELPAEVAAQAVSGVPAVLKESSEATRGRAEVLASVEALLEEVVIVGLVHCGASVGERLTTLAISALSVNLPRLALALRSLADEIRLLLAQTARADAGRCLWFMAHTAALARALAGAEGGRAELVGAHRSQYDAVDALELTGLCAYPWRTASGYQGLTVLLWDERRQEWASWSEARPEGQPGGFDPRARYGAEIPWEGGLTPQRLSRSRLRLRHARRNPAGRLSSSSRCAASVIAPSVGTEVAFGPRLFTRWDALRAHAAENLPLGLRESRPLREIIVAQPARWLEREFDSVTQIFRWWVEDDAGETLALELPFDAWSRQAIDTLERLPAPTEREAPPWRIVARVQRQSGSLSLHPLTLLSSGSSGTIPQPVLHLHLDAAAAPPTVAFPAPRQSAPEEEGEDADPTIDPDPRDEEDTDAPWLDGTTLDRALMPLEARLESLAEAGSEAAGRGAHGEWFRRQRGQLEALGLGVLSRSAGRIVDGASAREVAAEILHCRYFCGVYRQAASKAAQASGESGGTGEAGSGRHAAEWKSG